jgi:predicted ATPase
MLAHPISEANVRYMLGMLHLFRGEGPAAQQQAEASIRLATAHDLAERAAQATNTRGSALVLQGHVAEGIAQLTQGLAATRAIGGVLCLPYYLSLLAVAYGHSGQLPAGRRVLAEALAVAEQTGEHWWQAELYRLQGEFLLQQGSAAPHQLWVEEAEACLQQGLDTARRQQARGLELRAAVSLSRLWQQQGKTAVAHRLVAEVYGWFTEGFDTVDLQEAKALLEGLGE